MTEQLLQYIWRYGYFTQVGLCTISNENISIISRGTYNTNQGPDFGNASIQIGITKLVGNIELHVLSSHWAAHKHCADVNYQNIVLHVVWQHDLPSTTIHSYPILELKNYVSKQLLLHYATLQQNQTFIPCQSLIHTMQALHWQAWYDRLLTERLQQKTALIYQSLQDNKGSWEELFWQKLARNFGSTVNADSFENMAINTPVTVLAKNKISLPILEAILMGQAGVLKSDIASDYGVMLCKEYAYQKQKYGLQPTVLPVHYLRMRPPNFPTIRLSQLAALVHSSNGLFGKLLACNTYYEVQQLLHVKANDFWHYHYTFTDEPSEYAEKYIGTTMIENIIINTIVPTLFAYGMYTNQEKYKEKAIVWLQALKPEVNVITKAFVTLGVVNKNAYHSQALLQLYKHYCTPKHCLQCMVGNAVLKF